MAARRSARKQAAERRRGGLQRLFLGDPDQEGGGLRGLRFLMIGVALIAVFAVLLFIVRGPGQRGRPVDMSAMEPEAQGFGPATRSYALYYMDQGANIVQERRELTVQTSRTEAIRAVIEELLAGSSEGNTPLFPEGTQLRNLFANETGIVFVDLTREAVRGQSGSSAAEYASLAGLVRTVLSNFPEHAAVQLLIDGEPATSLGGHFSIERPLVGSAWAAP